MNIIHSVFSLVLKFRSQLISQPWGPAEHPNFALMQQSYSTFKYYSHFLFKGELSPRVGCATGHPSSRWLTRSPALCPPPPSGDEAGEPRLPAPPGGLPAADQLQQLLPGRLSVHTVTTQTRARTDAAAHFIPGLHPRSGSQAMPPPRAGKVGGAAARPLCGACRWAAESASGRDRSGPDWMCLPSWRVGLQVCALAGHRLLDSAGRGASGASGWRPPRQLRGSCDTEFRRPEWGLAAVGAPPACLPTGPLGLGGLQGLGGLVLHAVRRLQQL